MACASAFMAVAASPGMGAEAITSGSHKARVARVDPYPSTPAGIR